jgi:predicted O-linked N-acetylglucosamine transferase (SPINDLY family)
MTTQEAYQQAADHFRSGRLPQAEFILQQVIAREPRHADAQHLMGLLCHRYGHTPLAVGFVRRAIEFNPRQPEYYNSLATLLAVQDGADSALTAARKALGLAGEFPEAFYNLGCLLAGKGEVDEAISALRRALSLRPIYPEAEFQLGKLLKATGQLDPAIASFRSAAAMSHDAGMAGALLHALYFQDGVDAGQIAMAHARWNQAFATPQAGKPRPHAPLTASEAGRKLRIGYVSANFREHFVGRLLAPLLANHDRDQFEIYCYSDVERPDDMTRRFDSFDHVWRNTVGISDDDLAVLVRQDRIDILIDLSLHLEGNRLLTFAQKPASIQATYLAYCGTSGSDTMDYRLTDPYLDVSGDEVYVERPVRLKTYFCYEKPYDAPAVAPLAAQQAGHVTFGCLNDYSKLTAATWDAWRKILAAVEGSTLLVHAPPGSHRELVRGQFAADGIDPQRLNFVDRLPREQYMAQYNQIDIALDPFPYPGGLTTCDALWMGVPVVSLAGSIGAGRAGLSILTNAGFPEMVATTTEQYVQTAVAAASDLARLAAMRTSLRDRLRTSPLMNATAFAKDFEAIYRKLWCARRG